MRQRARKQRRKQRLKQRGVALRHRHGVDAEEEIGAGVHAGALPPRSHRVKHQLHQVQPLPLAGAQRLQVALRQRGGHASHDAARGKALKGQTIC